MNRIINLCHIRRRHSLKLPTQFQFYTKKILQIRKYNYNTKMSIAKHKTGMDEVAIFKEQLKLKTIILLDQ